MSVNVTDDVCRTERAKQGRNFLLCPADLEGSIRGGVCSLAECLTVSLFFSPLCHLPVAHLWLLSVGLLRLLLLAEPVEQPLR